ncbi:DUF2953 domain-containing protein [Thalassobacillus devorans]|uniref:DUF2953 domain-containing protein n=1 Tax=Thalassobacillus devorans TaxID=279813 RepID=UPI00049182A3|nr:DUF2953 domain-containing protein [Thalassobacillus devorans]
MEWIWITFLLLMFVLAGLLFIRISLKFHLIILPIEKRLTLVAYLGFLPVYRKRIDFNHLADGETGLAHVEKKAEEFLRQQNRDDNKKRNLNLHQLVQMGRAITIHKMNSMMRVGTGNASSTGSVAGGLIAIGSLLEQLINQLFTIKKPAHFRVEPSFQMPCFHVHADGIFSFRLGKAIYVWLRYVNR